MQLRYGKRILLAPVLAIQIIPEKLGEQRIEQVLRGLVVE
jgi:hypothetical protein